MTKRKQLKRLKRKKAIIKKLNMQRNKKKQVLAKQKGVNNG